MYFHLSFAGDLDLKFVDGDTGTKHRCWESVFPHLWKRGPAAHARACAHSRARIVTDSSDKYLSHDKVVGALCYNTHNEMSFLHHTRYN